MFVLNYAYNPGKCVCIIVEEKSDLRRIAFNGVGFRVRDMSMNAAEIIGSCRLRRRSNSTKLRWRLRRRSSKSTRLR